MLAKRVLVLVWELVQQLSVLASVAPVSVLARLESGSAQPVSVLVAHRSVLAGPETVLAC